MISVSSPMFDINGNAVIRGASRQGVFDISRRVNRIATLDGGAAFNDFGYSESDRVLTIEWAPSKRDRVDNLRRMVRQYSRLLISCKEGMFIGAPESFTASGDTVRLTILVERKLSA